MKRLKDLSIGKKLTVIQFLTAFIILILCSAVFVFNDIRVFRKSLVSHLSSTAQILGGNAIVALVFLDNDTANTILSSLKREKEITNAAIFDAEGNRFAGYNQDGYEGLSFPKLEGEDHQFGKDSLILRQNILRDDEVMGAIYLRSNMSEFRDKVKKYIQGTVLVLLAGGIVALLLSAVMQRSISKPIINLARTAETVSNTYDYSIRARKEANDELGALCEGFNQMLTQIQHQDAQLREARDILEERVKQRTQELSEANEALVVARDNAVEASRAKSDFLANMSHEIRTPMNAILGFTEILGGLIEDRQQKGYLNSIQTSGRALLTLINDILDLSKVEAGKLELEYAAANPHQVVAEIETIFSQRVSEENLDFRVDIAPGLPETLILDEVRLKQILVNLISNAVKFTDDGYVKLSVHHRCSEADNRKFDLIFAVEDTGIGIPEDQRELIFGVFEQQRGQNINEYGGTGLGLAIAKRLVEIMGGEIAVTSEVGGGSTFTVHLKNIELATVNGLVEPQERGINIDAITFEPVTILVVDDVTSNRQVIEGYLSSYPFTLIEAEDGQAAVAATKHHSPDLVLMDMKMPVMDGYEATRRIKGDTELKTIPIVALTASAMKADQAEITRLCDGYLIKPINEVELIGALAQFLPHSVETSASIAVERSQAAPENKLAPETLEAETLEKLPELASILQGYLETQWEGLKQTSLINDVEAFGVQMRDLGNQYNYPPLIAWGERLSTQAQMFELDALPTTLDRFPRIIEQIQLLTQA